MKYDDLHEQEKIEVLAEMIQSALSGSLFFRNEFSANQYNHHPKEMIPYILYENDKIYKQQVDAHALFRCRKTDYVILEGCKDKFVIYRD